MGHPCMASGTGGTPMLPHGCPTLSFEKGWGTRGGNVETPKRQNVEIKKEEAGIRHAYRLDEDETGECGTGLFPTLIF